MIPFWLKFTDGTAGCCEGVNLADAVKIAEHLTKKTVKRHDPEPPRAGDRHAAALLGYEGHVFDGQRLPYPAQPLIWQFQHPVHGKCPAFCYSPTQCKGRGSCPRSRSCCD